VLGRREHKSKQTVNRPEVHAVLPHPATRTHWDSELLMTVAKKNYGRQIVALYLHMLSENCVPSRIERTIVDLRRILRSCPRDPQNEWVHDSALGIELMPLLSKLLVSSLV